MDEMDISIVITVIMCIYPASDFTASKRLKVVIPLNVVLYKTSPHGAVRPRGVCEYPTRRRRRGRLLFDQLSHDARTATSRY